MIFMKINNHEKLGAANTNISTCVVYSQNLISRNHLNIMKILCHEIMELKDFLPETRLMA